MMIVRGVNVFPTQIEELILKDERLAPHFVIELRREERLDTMTGEGRGRPGADDASRAACNKDLAHQIKALIGVTATVETTAARRDRALARQGEADCGFAGRRASSRLSLPARGGGRGGIA